MISVPAVVAEELTGSGTDASQKEGSAERASARSSSACNVPKKGDARNARRKLARVATVKIVEGELRAHGE